MKKLLLALVLGGLMSASASAATITLYSVGFSSSLTTAVTGVFTDSTSLTFNPITFNSLFCDGPDASLCGVGFDSGTATAQGPADNVLNALSSDTFTFGSITYTTNPTDWKVVGSGPFYGVSTSGIFTAPGFDPTPGYLDFSFQNVINEQSNFSASGSTIPEPGSMALLASGLIGLGLVARRRNKN